MSREGFESSGFVGEQIRAYAPAQRFDCRVVGLVVYGSRSLIKFIVVLKIICIFIVIVWASIIGCIHVAMVKKRRAVPVAKPSAVVVIIHNTIGCYRLGIQLPTYWGSRRLPLMWLVTYIT